MNRDRYLSFIPELVKLKELCFWKVFLTCFSAYIFSVFLVYKGFSSMGGMPLENGSPAMALPGPHQNKGSAITIGGSETESKPKKKICCACPDTKRLRDECIVEHGETACTKWIEAHRQCLRAEGFNV